MKVGILGSGDVGQALGRGFTSHGHDTKIGSRTPDSDKLKAWLKQVAGKASTGTFAKQKVIGILKEFGWPGASAGSRRHGGSRRSFPSG